MATKINASHILVKTQEEAQQLLEQIKSGKSFEDLAKEKSLCPSGKKGGSLGWFTHGQMVREFEKAAFSMKKGQISQPVKTQFGWHLIKVNDTWG
ncbi:peptidyl-prolyl cis-trans isomerase [Candidatus Woesearchaeota archaeon]|nr:peptidyl-prolyl cis-trans isomerase [Candidatus Woesearchaeota archaeon]